MYIVRAYTTFNTTREWVVDDKEKATEYAKRIITEGLWYKETTDLEVEVFLPVYQISKVKIMPVRPRETNQ